MIPVLVVADFADPFSWMAEGAMRRLEREGLVLPVYRALELRPAPEPLDDAPRVDAAADLAREMGLSLRQPPAAVRTRKAHELAAFARQHGREPEVREAVYAAYFGRGADIGRIDVLVEIARAAGLPASEARVVLDVDKHAPAVIRETADARTAGIGAVPVLFLGAGSARVRVDGVFPLEEWRRLVQKMARTTRD